MGASRQPRLIDYLDHMIEAAELTQDYVAALDEAGFRQDRKTQQAIVFNLMVLGEAATKIALEHAEFASAHADVPWAKMRGMRNRMAHGYFQVDLGVVWATVTRSLPGLVTQLRTLRSGLIS